MYEVWDSPAEGIVFLRGHCPSIDALYSYVEDLGTVTQCLRPCHYLRVEYHMSVAEIWLDEVSLCFMGENWPLHSAPSGPEGASGPLTLKDLQPVLKLTNTHFRRFPLPDPDQLPREE